VTRETRARLITAVGLVLVTVLYALIPWKSLAVGRASLLIVTFVVGVVGVSWLVMSQAQRFRRGGGHGPGHLRGLITAIWLGLLFFASIYYALALDDPGQMIGLQTKVDAVYFTLAIVSTVGFGDVSAAGQAARLVVCVNIAFNLVIIAIAVSSIQGAPGFRLGGGGAPPRPSELQGEGEQPGDEETEDGHQPS
jgi:hypothetical protein